MDYRPKERIVCLVEDVIEFEPSELLRVAGLRMSPDGREITHMKVCRSLGERAVWVPAAMLVRVNW